MKRNLLYLMTAMMLILGGTTLVPTQVYAQGVWEDDSWVEDDYGYYDEDFYWETDDEGWNNWYGTDYEDDWGYYYDNEWTEDEDWWDWW